MGKLFYKNLNLYLLLIFLVFSFMFTTVNLQVLSSDYGVYYANAMFLSDEYKLYDEAFDHKGPVFYLFIIVVGKIFGWGDYSTFLPILISSLLFLLSFLFFLKNIKINNKNQIFLLSFAAIACFFNQYGNASIVFFTSSLILFYLSFLIKFNNLRTIKYYFFSVLFLSMAILTRFDFIIFLLLIILQLIYFNKDAKTRILCFIILLVVFFAVYTFLFLYFGYKNELFLKTNVIFNFLYSSKNEVNFLSHFHKPDSVKIFFGSGIGVLLFIIINQMIYKIKGLKKKIILKKFEKISFLSFFTFFLFFVLFLVPKLDQNHYALHLNVGSLILSSVLMKYVNIKRIFIFPILSIFLYSIFSHTLKPTINFFKTYGCIKRIDCPSFSSFKDTIDDVKNYNNVAVIYGNGWINILSNTPPKISLVNWPMIENNKIGNFFNQVNYSKEELLKKGQVIWLKDSLYKKYLNSPINQNHKIIDKQSSYLKIQIN